VPAGPADPASTPAAGITISFAGDVNFAERTADRLAADPATAFGAAAPGLTAADLTVVNLETAITTGGTAEPKSFTFRAPPTALTALQSAGIDVASMANNHGADYGETGLRDTVAAIDASGFPVIGIGADDARATAPYRTVIKGVDVAIFAASQVRDRTLQTWTATADRPGIANAFDPRLLDNVRAAAAEGATVIVFLHWGTEYESCPDGDQQQLAAQLAAAGATAVVGAHAHVLQGAGWRPDGVYIAYGLSNFLWWRSFGNEQDDNGVLTLTIDGRRVVGDHFAPSRLADDGVPVPASGEQADRINAEWVQVRRCADLAAEPPA
jgi:poly-gamma-glutamate synthesis protein (capsule biosynthesis protein)